MNSNPDISVSKGVQRFFGTAVGTEVGTERYQDMILGYWNVY